MPKCSAQMPRRKRDHRLVAICHVDHRLGLSALVRDTAKERKSLRRPAQPIDMLPRRGVSLLAAAHAGAIGVGSVRRAQHRHKDLRPTHLAGVRINQRLRLPGIVNEELVAGPMQVPHRAPQRSGIGRAFSSGRTGCRRPIDQRPLAAVQWAIPQLDVRGMLDSLSEKGPVSS